MRNMAQRMSSSLSTATTFPIWHIEMLGILQVLPISGKGQVITRFRSHQTGALLGFLAFYKGRAFGRMALVEMLWPGCDEKSGRNRLSVVLSSLRAQLAGEAPVFEADRDSIALRADVVTTDVGEFERYIKAAAQNPTEAREPLSQALRLYRGTLLPGYDQEWIAPQARRIEEEFFRAARRLIALYREAGERGRALSIAQRAVLVDPTREDVQRELIRLLVQTGQLEAARKQGDEVERVLVERLGSEPDATTRALLREIESRAQNRVRGAKIGPSSLVVNRPAPLTRFFGRESNLEALRSWLQSPEERLLTLTGSGGSGKTRLLIETARALEAEPELMRYFDGGAWFVPLAEVSEAESLPEALRGALHLPPSPGVDATQQLLEVLAAGKALLLLDNFEQLVPDGVAFVRSLLEQLSNLKILVSSRRRLALSGEHEHLVSPLSHTSIKIDSSLSVAAALFEDRARLSRPQFALDAPTFFEAVNAVCVRLDGLPLAIELAAARTNVLSPTQILAHLDEKFDLLASTSTERVPRHRTLRTALDWSFRLLPRELQEFWARLSVFRGGWTLEAARDVLDEKGALDALSHLRDCSLLITSDDNGEMRFGLLETLREFGHEHLTLGECKEGRRRHAEFYANWAQKYGAELHRAQQVEWLSRFNAESENMRAALVWSLANEPRLALRLSVWLADFWKTRGHYAEGKNWLRAALEANENTPFDDLETQHWRARALCGQARLVYLDGDLSGARALFESCLELERQLENRAGIAAALGGLGWVVIQHGENGASLLEESLALYDETGATDGLADALFAMASASGWRSESTRQKAYEYLKIFRERGDLQSVVIALSTLGAMAFFSGEGVVAKPLLEEGLQIARKLGKVWDLTLALWILGNLARGGGDLPQAHALYCESLFVMRRAGKWPVPLMLQSLGALALDEGDPLRSVRLLGAAEAAWPPQMRTTAAVGAERDQYLAKLRETLPATEFEAAWNYGQSLSLDQGVALALEGYERSFVS